MRQKDVDDLLRVYRTYKRLKKRSPLAAELFLDDVAFAVGASARMDPGDRYFSMQDPRVLRLALNVLERFNRNAARFYRKVLLRALQYLPEEKRRAWERALRRPA